MTGSIMNTIDAGSLERSIPYIPVEKLFFQSSTGQGMLSWALNDTWHQQVEQLPETCELYHKALEMMSQHLQKDIEFGVY